MRRILSVFRPLNPESAALLHLDSLRIIAALGVIVFHFRLAVAGAPLVLPIHLEGLHMMVDLFFVLSGFVIAYVYTDRIAGLGDYLDFLRKRVARLGPLHWATLLIFVALGAVAASGLGAVKASDSYDWRCLPAQIAMVHAWGVCDGASFNTPSWSISAEMGMYLIFPVLLLAARRAAWLFALALVALLAGLELLSGARPWTERTFDFGVLRALPSFMFGLLLYAGRERLGGFGRGLASRHVWIALTVVLIAIFMGAPQILVLLALYALAAVAVAADFGPEPTGRVFQRIAPWGQLSYGVYMLHFPVQAVVIAQIGVKLLHLQGWALAAMVVAAVPATFAAAYVSLSVFELPLRRLLAGRRRTPEDAVAIP